MDIKYLWFFTFDNSIGEMRNDVINKDLVLGACMLAAVVISGCDYNRDKEADTDENTELTQKNDEYIEMAVKMADSDIKRNPEAWMLDFNTRPRWNYTYGVVCSAMENLWKHTGEDKYLNYILDYADTMIDNNGNILTYDPEAYNIDMINSGKFLFAVYQKIKDPKYKKAIDLLREQMKTHPRTSEGGFWHKKRYPWQMWLDGLYMASPFLAQYAQQFNEPELFDDVASQIHVIREHTRDPETGLYYHGWDESKSQAWADPETGLSENFWGRGMGWLAMAMVDVLDYFPKDHPQYDEIIENIKEMAEAVKKYQDEDSGVWYQVLDQKGRSGNYLESSASTMFVYFLYKAVRLGYIDRNYLEVADRGLDGVMNEFIETGQQGNVEITKACAGAGLGGDPYRDGSYDYYINESIRNNDPKAVGPYINMLIEKSKLVVSGGPNYNPIE